MHAGPISNARDLRMKAQALPSIRGDIRIVVCARETVRAAPDVLASTARDIFG